MSKRLKQAALVLVFVLAAAQLIRPNRANPAVDPSHTMHAQLGTTNGLVAVLDRGCGDCHSNATAWPWFTQIAPLSWLMASGVKQGREVVNFSEWTTYSVERQRALLTASCTAVKAGKMPGVYAVLQPRTRLSPQDIDTICAAAR